MKKTVQKFTKNFEGFTLVELLIVIAIIAILAVVVAVIINPIELRRRANDSTRLADIANLQQAINVAVQEATGSGATILCSQTGTYPCFGESFNGTRNSNGTGWVKVNLSSQNAVSVPVLPIDPINTTGGTGYHYAYCANTGEVYELNGKLESTTTNGSKMTNDGGDNNVLYEVGSGLTLMGVGICVY